MVFSSHIFVFYFLPLALLLYYAAPRAGRSLVLTLVSYVFYGWWNPWYTLLILGSTVIDYGCGKMISAEGASPGKRKAGVWISVLVNLSILAFFKYTAFALGTFDGIVESFGPGGGIQAPSYFYNIILPIGISFYTFQSMSYSIDIYRGHARPAPSFIDFACYVSMFPQLVAGPIVRYGSVAEQIRSRPHTVDGFVAGLTRFNFGFAKKILLANPMGQAADLAFGAGEGVLGTPAAWLGIIAYAFQIYFDFSAYSDMAIGLGRMFGFRFPENFDSPYKAVSITDFWRRWHISLSSFLRDYLYIPLGGNRKGEGRTYVNLLTVMVLGGLWHGAQWTFLVWGIIHGGWLALERAMGRNSFYGRLPKPVKIGITFVIVLIAWVFFRSENFEVAGRYLASMFGFGESSDAGRVLLGQLTRPFLLFSFALAAVATWFCPRTAAILAVVTPKKVALGLVLFALSLAAMFAQGFNPFLYFQF